MIGRLSVNARKLDRLLSDLLDLDRLSRGILKPRRRPTDLSALVRQVVAGYETSQPPAHTNLAGFSGLVSGGDCDNWAGRPSHLG